MSRAPVFFVSLAAAGLLAATAHGQAVISTHAGLVHFFEGAVTVAGQPLEQRLGRFSSIPDGAELRTAQGRAEVLLTPGVFLRVGDNSAIRLVSSLLSDTRVELLSGSAILDSEATGVALARDNPPAVAAVTLIYQGWSVHQREKGIYRLDCDPPRVRVETGEVDVMAAGGASPVAVQPGDQMPLAAVLAPEKAPGDAHDALSDWSAGRAQSVTADNAIASGIQDPISLTGIDVPLDGFTYYPMLGLASLSSMSPSPYGTAGLYTPGGYGVLTPQLGFYSMYLPGYTYQPMLLGLPLGRLPGIYSPGSIHLPGGLHYPTGVYSPGRLGTTRLPSQSPVTVRPAPHVVGHIGGHR